MERKGKKPAQPYHHGDLKHALIQAGLKVLAEQGAANLNLREVARQASVSHTAPYRHFADKQTLLAAIAAEGFEKLAHEIRLVDAKPLPSTSQKLAAAGQAYVRFALKHPDHFRLMFSRMEERAENETLHHVSKVGFEFLVRTISAAQANNEFVPNDALEQAKALWAMVHGLAVLVIENQFAADTRKPVSLKQAENMTAHYIQMMVDGFSR